MLVTSPLKVVLPAGVSHGYSGVLFTKDVVVTGINRKKQLLATGNSNCAEPPRFQL
jgi:hypothetical protein